MGILEAVVCGAVELCCVILRGVSNILSISFISVSEDVMLDN